MLEGPGPSNSRGSRGQAPVNLARLGLEAGSVQRSYTYLGIYYAF